MDPSPGCCVKLRLRFMPSSRRTWHFISVTTLRFFKQRRLKSIRKEKISLHSYKLLLPILVFFFIAHLRYAFHCYYVAVHTIPPRSSTIDHSVDFDNSTQTRLFKRHTTSWRKYPDLEPEHITNTRSPSQSKHRYLVSAAGREVGDGLGHRFLVVNYERQLAHALNLTYVHRRATYGSLTAFERNAVDLFFGWIRNREPTLTRDAFFRKVCAKTVRKMIYNGCVEKVMFCKRLREFNGLVDHLVQIPKEVALCLKSSGGRTKCRDLLRTFTKQHHRPKTLFYTPTNICSWKLFWSDQHFTRGWFYDRYWTAPRKSRMDPRYVNIALHVRRGDFLKHSNRLSISDIAYARVVRRIVSIVSEEEQDNSGGPVTLQFKLHIYSQGAFNPQSFHPIVRYLAGKGIFGSHNVNDYGTQYVSENGIETPDGYWEKLLGNHSRISCDLHVSENTLEGLEQMISADILVGSVSALSVHVAAQLSRGIPFLPVSPPQSVSSNMTIQWDPSGSGIGIDTAGRYSPDDFYFNGEHFRSVWRQYRRHIGAEEKALGT